MSRSRRVHIVSLIGGFLVASAVRAGSVSGKVTDASGAPAIGARVEWSAFRDEDQTLLDETRGADRAILGAIQTDASGHFRVALEKPGVSISIRILAANLPAARLPGPYDSSEDVSVADIALPAASRASGRVVDETGKPVANARVLVRGGDLLSEEDVQFSSEVKTAADGSYSMPNAPAAPRSLRVSAPGLSWYSRLQLQPAGDEHVVLRRGGTVKGTVVDANGNPVAGAIVVAGDLAAESDGTGRFQIPGVPPGTRHVQTIWKEDFAARADGIRVQAGAESEVPLKLARAASLSGVAVEENTKKPIAGARIAILSGGGRPFAANPPERTAHTDGRGRFRIGGLANRPYTVEAVKEGYLTSSLPGVATSVDKPGTANLALRRAASVAGKVVDESGKPVPGARIAVAQELNFRDLRGRGLAGAAAALMGRSANSGADGTFRLRNVVPARNLELEASKSGFATAKQPGVTLKPGDAMQGVSFVLKKGLQARGRVVDAQGQPVSGAEIRLAFREAGARAARMQFRLMGMDREKPDASSAADGTFLVGGLSVGQYAASISRQGFAQKSVPSLAVKSGEDNVWAPITLTAGIALTGVVRDSSGDAIPGAQILAIEPGSGGRPFDASTGPDGRFRFDGLNADRPLMLNVSADGHASVQKEVTPPAEDLAIVMKSSGTIRGRVENGDTKTPVTDFVAGAHGNGNGGRFVIQLSGRGVTDKPIHSEDGSFELGDVAPGKWTVHVTAEGYRPADVAGVEVAEGATKDGVVISLKRGGGVTGRVVDPQQGTGVANASVTYQSSSGAAGGGGGLGRLGGLGGGANANNAVTDADGRFSLDAVPDGKIMVTASHPDYLDVTQEVDTTKQSTIDLTLGTGGSIAGAVVGQDGRTPIPGSQVSLNQEGDTQFGFGSDSTRSDGSGNFLFEHLQAGRFKVIAQSNDGKTISQEVVLSDGQRLTGVLLQMASGALLQGTVSGLPTGRLGGIRVSASAPNYNDNTTTDDSGKYSLANVPSGVVRLNANTSFLSGRSTSQSVEIPPGAPEFTADIVFQGASRLSGRVVRGDTPLSGVYVNANPISTAAMPGAGRANGQTDDNGQYTLDGLTDGDYAIIVTGQGVAYRKTFTVSGDTAGDILLPAIQVTGTVTELGSGEPLDGATIQAQPQTSDSTGGGRFSMKMGTGDSTGRFTIDDVDPGTYQVTARRDGYQAKVQTITVGSDSQSVDFGLQRGEGISVRIADGITGLPLKGVIVSAVDGGGGVGYQGAITLDSSGKGEINSLAPGQYSVHFSADGYASRTSVMNAPSPLTPVMLTPGGRVDVTMAVPFSGRVVDSSGLPYQLNAFRSDGRVSGSPPVVSWQHVAPGSYQLLVGPAGAEVPFPFNVVEGQTTTVVVK
jgi:large repetitive protein